MRRPLGVTYGGGRLISVVDVVFIFHAPRSGVKTTRYLPASVRPQGSVSVDVPASNACDPEIVDSISVSLMFV